MAKKTVSVEVESSGLELMEHFAKIASAYKQALKDGFQPGQDIPQILVSLIAEGPGIMANVVGSSGDLAEDKLEFVKGINLGAYDLAQAALSG